MTHNVLITPTKPCAAVIVTGDPRSRPPPRTAYIKGPRAHPRARLIPSPHQRHARPLGGPRGGLLPQLRPPRSASAATSIRSGEATSGAQTPSVTPSSYQEPNPLLNLISAALSDESLDHPSRRPSEQSSPSTCYSPVTNTTTNRRGRMP